MSASVIATELKLPLYTVVLDNLITRYMGETAAKLRLIFDHIRQTRAVYFLMSLMQSELNVVLRMMLVKSVEF